ncbi:MAG: hypothetical protein KBS35_00955 [Mycoplasma sp.]|nr:hypothetical protein [Candidatus Hennigella equi]
MAFITNEKRQSLIKKINQSYGLKKALVLIEIVALIAFIIVTFLSLYKDWQWFEGDKLTTLGIGMMVAAAIIVVLGLISVILVFTLRSPKSVKKDMKTLESSALSGKRVYKTQTAGDVMRSRRRPEDDKKKKK